MPLQSTRQAWTYPYAAKLRLLFDSTLKSGLNLN